MWKRVQEQSVQDPKKQDQKVQDPKVQKKQLHRWKKTLGLCCLVLAAGICILEIQDIRTDAAALTETAGGKVEAGEAQKSLSPSAFPDTGSDAVKTITYGEKILLTSTEAGAEIYYTTDGTEPLREEAYRYHTAIEALGDYGGNYMIKAKVWTPGKEASDTAVFVYKIAEKKELPKVTALPDPKTKVIPGDHVVLSCQEPGAVICYTVDGSTPSVTETASGEILPGEGSMIYQASQAVKVPEADSASAGGVFCVTAVAAGKGWKSSAPAQFVYTYEETAGLPYSEPVPGKVAADTEVVLKSDQEGAVLYYEIGLQGKEPAEPGKQSKIFAEDAPLRITGDTVIKVRAEVNRQMSETAVLKFQVMQEESASGTAAAAGQGSSSTGNGEVSSSSTIPSGTVITLPGTGDIVYTTDGSDPLDPENRGIQRGNKVTVNGNPGDQVTIRACVRTADGQPGREMVYDYLISQYPGGVSTDLPQEEAVRPGTELYFITDVTDAVIYYTTEDVNPAEAGKKGEKVTLEGEPGETIRVRAAAVIPGTEMKGSYAGFTYQLMDRLDAPMASVKDGSVLTKAVPVELKAKEGTIYFTTDGTTPTRDSWQYTEPVLIQEDTFLQAIAVGEDVLDSEIAVYAYRFAPRTRKPRTSAAAGKTEYGKMITLSCADSQAEIYYTTDGSDPDPDAEEGVFLYDEDTGICIQKSVTIKAAAVREGYSRSEVLSVQYIVEEIPEHIGTQADAKGEAGLIPLNTERLESRRPDGEAGLQIREVTASDVIHNVVFGAAEEAVPEKVTIGISEIAVSAETREELERKLGPGYRILKHYDLSLYAYGEQIELQGKAEVGFPVPAGYQDAELLVARVGKNGEVSIQTGRRDGEYIYTTLGSTGGYAVIGMIAEEEQDTQRNIPLLILAGTGVVFLAGAGWIFRLLTASGTGKRTKNGSFRKKSKMQSPEQAGITASEETSECGLAMTEMEEKNKKYTSSR